MRSPCGTAGAGLGRIAGGLRLDPRTLPPDWPHRSAGRRLRAGSVDWWVIDTGGPGPVVLLLHGLGASGHSFARMIPGLAAQFRVIVPDLPGHGGIVIEGGDAFDVGFGETLDGDARLM